MYAIVDILGQQFKAEKGKTLFVHRMEEQEGAKVSFPKVLLLSTGDSISLAGSGATVQATVMEHLKGDKVVVFKKKRRKGYRLRKGHRQYLTKIHIDDIAV